MVLHLLGEFLFIVVNGIWGLSKYVVIVDRNVDVCISLLL